MAGALALLAMVAAGCGGSDPAPTAATPTPTPTPTAANEEEAEHRFEPGHSKAVREYYGEAHEHSEEPSEFGFGETEAEYHEPPRPPAARLGDPITLTGTNLGVRLRVTPVRLARQGDAATLQLALANTGVAIFESPIRNATIAYGPGRRARGKPCSETIRIEPSAKGRACMRFRIPAGARPRTLHLALEQVPAAAGGRWTLR